MDGADKDGVQPQTGLKRATIAKGVVQIASPTAFAVEYFNGSNGEPAPCLMYYKQPQTPSPDLNRVFLQPRYVEIHL